MKVHNLYHVMKLTSEPLTVPLEMLALVAILLMRSYSWRD